ncbi:uncharacterized protein LOC118434940 [Folsomia candida]|uniref:uncharacterized protein LOC118434940 n=1 Tax=Folsomia candida TaxID=158441 RepID=UPI00160555FD|nr:uncharacterized protein LOC118434940 [Folsomia candida]
MDKSDERGGEESAVLKLISNPLPAVIPLGMKRVVVGRSPTCDIVLNLPEISAQHCYLEFNDNRWFIKDISLNGVWVGGEKLDKNKPRLLNHRDLIKFGPKLIYRFNNNQTKENVAEGTVFLEERWWNENELGGRCFIMGRWWKNLQEWLDETNQKLEYNGPQSPQAAEDVSERMEEESNISLEIEQPVAKIARFEDSVDVGGADTYIKRRLFCWLAKPHPTPISTWKPPTQGLGKLFCYIRDQLKSKGWRGKEEDMKLSAEYKEWLRTLTGIKAYQQNLKDVDLNFNGMPIFVYLYEGELFYAIGKLKKGIDPKIGSTSTIIRNNYEVNSSDWGSVCHDCRCWKKSTTKRKCEEHGERNQELFLVIDRHNKDKVVLMLFNTRPRSSDHDQKSLNENIHSAEVLQSRSLRDYMTERGVPEFIPKVKRLNQYKAMKYTDKKIQQLEEKYWEDRLSKVELEVLEKWKLPNSKKDVYNQIYDTVQVFILNLIFIVFNSLVYFDYFFKGGSFNPCLHPQHEIS